MQQNTACCPTQPHGIIIHVILIFHFYVRYDNNRLLLALDSGELEIWQVTLPGNTMDCAATLSGGHHDMALCLNVLENNTMLSGGANGR